MWFRRGFPSIVLYSIDNTEALVVPGKTHDVDVRSLALDVLTN
jgi:hypothetical protein